MDIQTSIKDQIDNVTKSTIKYIFRKLYIQLTLLAIYFATMLYLFIHDTGQLLSEPPASDDGQYFLKFVLYFLIPPAVLYFSYQWIKGKVIEQFIKQFAETNGLEYTERDNLIGLDGSLFVLGKDRYFTDICSGYFNNLSIRLFNYYYKPYSEQSKEHNSTVFEIEFEYLLPPLILLVDHHNFGGSMTVNLEKPIKLKLEGDFDNFFDLYTERGLEVESLEIFSPDFMIQIRDNWENFSFEFTKNHIYIYSHKLVLNKTDLQNMAELVQYLVGHLTPVLERMQTGLKQTLAVSNK